MNTESPVTLRKIAYRGVMAFQLTWQEHGAAQEKSFALEADAVMEMSAIETRLREEAMAGKGLTVNPFGAHVPFINSKDVHFAAMKLQPRGLKFRDAIEDYVAAAITLKGTGITVAEAARSMADAATQLRPFDTTTTQAIYEWVELKKQFGERPLFELLRAYLQSLPKPEDAPTAPAAPDSPPAPASPSPASS